MTAEEVRCHWIAFEFGLNPHILYETWSVEEIAQTYSFLKKTKLTKSTPWK